MPDSLRSHGLYTARLLCSWNYSGKNTGVGSQPFPSPGDLPNPGIKPGSPELQADSLPPKPQGSELPQQSHYWAYTLKKIIIEKDTCTPVFIAPLFTIARTWKQPRCPSADEQIKMMRYIYTMEYYSTMKRNKFASVL